MWGLSLLPVAVFYWSAAGWDDICVHSAELEMFVLQDGSSSFANKLRLSPAVMSELGTELQSRHPAVRFGTAEFSDVSRGSKRTECYLDLMKISPDMDQFVAAAHSYRPLDSNENEAGGLENSLGALAYAASGGANFTPYYGRDNILRVAVIITDGPSRYGNQTSPDYQSPEMANAPLNCDSTYPSLFQVRDAVENNGVHPIILNPVEYLPWWESRMEEMGLPKDHYELQELHSSDDGETYVHELVEDIGQAIARNACHGTATTTRTTTRTTATTTRTTTRATTTRTTTRATTTRTTTRATTTRTTTRATATTTRTTTRATATTTRTTTRATATTTRTTTRATATTTRTTTRATTTRTTTRATATTTRTTTRAPTTTRTTTRAPATTTRTTTRATTTRTTTRATTTTRAPTTTTRGSGDGGDDGRTTTTTRRGGGGGGDGDDDGSGTTTTTRRVWGGSGECCEICDKLGLVH
eukprot:Gregarina_sp_Poly_1__3456@NODE_1_length_32023_cov_193_025347_g0_i0_p4_GENE_NODE_1_length_32023_cov_193_025347_g0_i0NODE_1_length_32023_cov_193_025347_g0_i0_p4_ORF_typecomplete_len472_score25_14Integrin_beta/PF00362_18/1_6e06FAM196/PF15265_6/0_00041SBE2/PF17076_5/0_37AspBHydro_N/PF05279_11/6_9KAR9/PF08580_10/13_NODE_1_length_32023_cov_193_025347_g0_i01833319748